jgi:hypothetical protein
MDQMIDELWYIAGHGGWHFAPYVLDL